jgi:hypothetical protein
MTILRVLFVTTSFALALGAGAGCKKKDEPKPAPAVEPAVTGSAAPTPVPAGSDSGSSAAPAPEAKPAGPTVGACTVKEDKSCSETKLNNPGDFETYGKQCADISKGTWAEGPCPMDKVIGECNSASAGRTVFYKGAKDAKHTCEQMIMGGVWTAAAK